MYYATWEASLYCFNLPFSQFSGGNFVILLLCHAFVPRKNWLIKKGKFVSDIPHKSAPFVPSRAGYQGTKHETFSKEHSKMDFL